MQPATKEVIAALDATPNWLREAFASESAPKPEAPNVDGEWNLADIIAHLRASDAIVAPRIVQVLIRPGAALVAFDERAWAEVAATAGISVSDQLAAFALQRGGLIGVLRSLTDDQ